VNIKNLYEKYKNIQVSPIRGLFFITKLQSNFFLTKAKSGRSALGFTFEQPQPKIGDSVFEGIGIQYFQNGEVVFNKKKRECSFVIIENLEEENRDRFYDLVQDLADEIKYEKRRFIDISEIVSYLISWAALFRRRTLSKNKDTLGLFGELYLIQKCRKPEILLQRWRAPNNSKHDFSYGKNLLDVKTSTIGREHHFELEQVSPSKEYKKYIASICVKESNQGGESIQQVIKKLIRKVSRTDLQKAINKRTKNMHLGKNKYLVTSMCIYDSLDIPQPYKKSDYVFDISFVSNLCSVKKTLSFDDTINKFL